MEKTGFFNNSKITQILDGFQNFSAGEITTTTVELTRNDNGGYFGNIFGNIDTILILKKDDPKTHIYKAGSILTTASNQVRIIAKNGNTLTLSAVPKNNVEIRIWYKYSASNIPLNYFPLPFSLSAKAIQSYTTQWLALASSSSPTTLTQSLSMNDFPMYFRGSNGSDTNHFIKYNNFIDGVEIKGYAGILLSGSSGIEFGGDLKLNNKKIEFTNTIFGTSSNYYMGFFSNPNRLEIKAYSDIIRLKNSTEVEGNLTASGTVSGNFSGSLSLNSNKLYLRSSNNNVDYIEYSNNKTNFSSNSEFNFNKFIEIAGSKTITATSAGGAYDFDYSQEEGYSDQESYSLTAPYSLKTSERVLVKGVTITSDKRLKENIEISSKQENLKVLEKIKISDYNLIGNSNKEKKIIAQDLEKVFPQAVSKIVDFIPNINKHVFIKNLGKDSIEIDLNNHNLVSGDELRFKIFKRNNQYIDQQSIDLFVKKVEKEKIFLEYSDNCNLQVGQKIYLFGKKVQDVRMIDYQEVFCLNVSATQELLERVRKLEDIILNLIK